MNDKCKHARFLYIIKHNKVFLVLVHHQLCQLYSSLYSVIHFPQLERSSINVIQNLLDTWHSAVSKRVVGKTIQGFTNQHVGLLVLPSLLLCTQSQLIRARSEENLNSFNYCVYKAKSGWML